MSGNQKSKAKKLALPVPTSESLAFEGQRRIAEALESGDRVVVRIERYATIACPSRVELDFKAGFHAHTNVARLSALMLAVASMLEAEE